MLEEVLREKKMDLHKERKNTGEGITRISGK